MIRWRVRKDPDRMMMDHAKWEVSVIVDGEEPIWIYSFPDMWCCHHFLDRLFGALMVAEQELIETYFRPV